MMDYEKLNPCGREWYVRLVQWAETGCWCCTATRAIAVALPAGIVLGLLLAGAWRAALVLGVLGLPVIAGALALARRVWKDSYAKEADSHEQ